MKRAREWIEKGGNRREPEKGTDEHFILLPIELRTKIAETMPWKLPDNTFDLIVLYKSYIRVAYFLKIHPSEKFLQIFLIYRDISREKRFLGLRPGNFLNIPLNRMLIWEKRPYKFEDTVRSTGGFRRQCTAKWAEVQQKKGAPVSARFTYTYQLVILNVEWELHNTSYSNLWMGGKGIRIMDGKQTFFNKTITGEAIFPLLKGIFEQLTRGNFTRSLFDLVHEE